MMTHPERNRSPRVLSTLGLLAVLATMAASPGCHTVRVLYDHADYERGASPRDLRTNAGYGPRWVYGGTRSNLLKLAAALKGGDPGLLLVQLPQLPLSVVFDTLVLPWTIYWQRHPRTEPALGDSTCE